MSCLVMQYECSKTFLWILQIFLLPPRERDLQGARRFLLVAFRRMQQKRSSKKCLTSVEKLSPSARARKISATFVLVRSSWWTRPSTSLVCLCFLFHFISFCFVLFNFLGNLFCLISLPFVRGLFCFVRDWLIFSTSFVFLSVPFRFIRELLFCFSTFRMCFYFLQIHVFFYLLVDWLLFLPLWCVFVFCFVLFR